MLIVPGAAGEIGVLARHAPLIATLKAGSTRGASRRRGRRPVQEYATGHGFFKVEQDRAIALVDDAVLAKEIDVERARGAARGRAGRAGADRSAASPTADRWQIEQRIKHAEEPAHDGRTAPEPKHASDGRVSISGRAICGIGRIASSCWKHLLAARRDCCRGVVDLAVARLRRQVRASRGHR